MGSSVGSSVGSSFFFFPFLLVGAGAASGLARVSSGGSSFTFFFKLFTAFLSASSASLRSLL